MIANGLCHATVMHARHAPRKNIFRYRISYFTIPLANLTSGNLPWLLSFNRFNIFSLFSRDYRWMDIHGYPSPIQAILNDQRAEFTLRDVLLITLPRILGYAFNPISFWCCFDGNDKLRAVVAEVRNTFGECHHYLCMHEDGRVIDAQDWLMAPKEFFVSPFLEVSGNYAFRFNIQTTRIAIVIHYSKSDEKVLSTSIVGERIALSNKTLLLSAIGLPLSLFRVIVLIHFQALRLWLKKIPAYRKPTQSTKKLTTTS